MHFTNHRNLSSSMKLKVMMMLYSDFHYNLFKAHNEMKVVYKWALSFETGSNQIRFQLEHCNCERTLNLRKIDTAENFNKNYNSKGKSEKFYIFDISNNLFLYHIL